MILAVDLGGTQMRAAFVDREGGILLRRAEPTPRDASCPDALLMLVGGLLEGGDAETAVIGVPGRVHYGTGTLEYAPNLRAGWAPSLTEAKLSAVLGLRVALANDADLAAVGESRFGAGRSYADVVYITISTGIGAGVILGGVLAHGRRSLAEVGHTIIDRAATGAGAPATLEYEGSGTALKRIAASEGFDRSGAQLVELVDSGDATAIRIWDSVAQAAGIGVANLAHLFSPEVVVVGGGGGGWCCAGRGPAARADPRCAGASRAARPPGTDRRGARGARGRCRTLGRRGMVRGLRSRGTERRLSSLTPAARSSRTRRSGRRGSPSWSTEPRGWRCRRGRARRRSLARPRARSSAAPA
jgi:glucokinase